MLVSLREHAGMSLDVENLQSGTPAATRNAVSVTVVGHGCVVVTGTERNRSSVSLLLLPAPSPLSSSLLEDPNSISAGTGNHILRGPGAVMEDQFPAERQGLDCEEQASLTALE